MKDYLRLLLKSNAYIYDVLSYIFDKLPFVFFKNKDYRNNIRTLQLFEGLSGDEINEWKYATLSKVIENAYHNVPFYSKLYREAGFHPKDFKVLGDLDKIPMITKADVKNNLEEFVSTNTNKSSLVVKYSGGSTETPLKFYVEVAQEFREASYYDFIWRKYGYRFGVDKCIVIKGDKIAHTRKKRTVLSKYSSRLQTLTFDSDYLNKLDYLQIYLDDITNFNSDVLFGYPSSIYQLAKSIELSGKQAPKFRLILLASENTYDDQNRFIKNIFGAEELFYHYGHSEQVLSAYKSRESDKLSFVPTYGYVELIENSINILGKDNFSVGELVGTNYSMAFPLIRFKTNDFAVNSKSKDSIFADNATVSSIQGRLQEYIVAKDNRLISLCSVAGAHFASLSKALEMQYIQNKPGFLVVQLVQNSSSPFTEMDIANVIKDLDVKFQFAVNISVEIVDKIPRLPSNKKSMINQQLNISEYLGN